MYDTSDHVFFCFGASFKMIVATWMHALGYSAGAAVASVFCSAFASIIWDPNSCTLQCVSISVAAAVCLWAGGFYMLFVWLVIFMRDLIEYPVPMPFAVNAISLCVTMVTLFPFGGWLLDVYGRKPIMTLGASGIALLAPSATRLVTTGDLWTALAAQLTLGIFLCLYGAPLCTFLVENLPRRAG